MGYSVIAHRYMILVMLPIGPLIYEYYEENGSLSHLKKILFITIILSSITLLTTLFALFNDPYVCRRIKSSGELTKALFTQGIAGYSFIYFIVICNQIVLFLFLKNKGIKRIIFLLTCIFLSFFVIKANYFTALLLMLIGFASMITIHLSLSNISHKFLLCFLFYGIIFFIFEFQSIFSLVGSFLPKRIYQVLDVGNTNFLSMVTEEFLIDRWPFMKTSLITFFEHPLGGLLLSNELEYSADGLSFETLGQHSYILDTFALYGIVLGIVSIFILLKPFKKNGILIKKNMCLTIPIMIVSFGLYFFNTATDTISLAICFFYPIVRDLFSDNIEVSVVYKKISVLKRDGT